MRPLPWEARPFNAFMAEKSTVNDDSSGAVTVPPGSRAGTAALCYSTLGFDELPQAAASQRNSHSDGDDGRALP